MTVSGCPAGASDDDRQPAGGRLEEHDAERLGLQPAQPGPAWHARRRHRRRTPAASPPSDTGEEAHRAGSREARAPSAASRRRAGPSPTMSSTARDGARRPAATPPSSTSWPLRATSRDAATTTGWPAPMPRLRRSRSTVEPRPECVSVDARGQPDHRRCASRVAEPARSRPGSSRSRRSGRPPASPIRRSSVRAPGHRRPPHLVAVGEGDEPACPRRRAGAPASRPSGAAAPKTTRSHPCSTRTFRRLAADAWGRQQHPAPVSDHLVSHPPVDRGGALHPRRVHDQVRRREAGAEGEDERLDATPPRRVVVRDHEDLPVPPARVTLVWSREAGQPAPASPSGMPASCA